MSVGSRSASKNGLGQDSGARGGVDTFGRGMGGRSSMMSDLDDGGAMRRGSSAPTGIKVWVMIGYCLFFISSSPSIFACCSLHVGCLLFVVGWCRRRR